MSVELHNVSKAFKDGKGENVVLEEINLRVGRGDRLAVLGGPRSGKTTLLRIMCGTLLPSSGDVQRDGTVSWPIPGSRFLSQWNTVQANIRFIARIYDVHPDDMIEKVSEMAEIRDFLNVKLNDCPRFVKVQTAFAIGVCVDFDIYLFEEKIAVGSKPFRKKALEIADVLSRDHGILFATSSIAAAASFCNTALVLDEGRVTYYTDMKSAIRHFKNVRNDAVVDPLDDEEDEDQDDDLYEQDPDKEEGDI